MHTDIPSRQESPLAWYGPDLHADADKWVIQLSAAEIAELEVAANKVAAHNRPIVEINKNNFPLPLLGPRLKKLSTQLIDGIGFALLRRIPVERYSVQQAASMFYGIGAHLGNARMQNASGHVLGHVCDLNMHSDEPNVRIYQTHERQTFHTDSSDIVGLLCLKKAKKGGESLLVSAVTIYNEMLEARPDLVRLLFDPIATDRRGEIPQGMQPFFSIPVYSWDRDNLTVMYQRQYIDSAQRFDDAMRLTSSHIQAWTCLMSLPMTPTLIYPCSLNPVTCNSSTTTGCCMIEPDLKTGRTSKIVATCCVYGCRRRMTDHCPQYSKNGLAALKLVTAAVSLCRALSPAHHWNPIRVRLRKN